MRILLFLLVLASGGVWDTLDDCQMIVVNGKICWICSGWVQC